MIRETFYVNISLFSTVNNLSSKRTVSKFYDYEITVAAIP